MPKIEKILLGIKKKHFWIHKRIKIKSTHSLAQIQSRIRRHCWEMGYNEAMKEYNKRVDSAIKRIKKLWAKKT